MFNKLLTNLPFNPSLVTQISFYGKRLQRESSIRRLGFVFISLAFFVQIFAVTSPPQPTLARSSNDLINGGITSKQQAVSACQSDIANYGMILANYNISCAEVAGATTMTLRSTDFNRQLYSMGRLPYGLAGETPVTINGLPTTTKFFWRFLWSWDTHGSSSYNALRFVSAGRTFFILFNCGNLVSIGLPRAVPPTLLPAPTPPPVAPPTLKPTPPPVKPCVAATSSEDTIACLVISKAASNITQNVTNADGTTAQAGDLIRYTLSAKNTGNATVKSFVFQENISDVLDYATVQNLNGGALDNSIGNLSWPAINIVAGQTIQKVFTVKVKSPIPNTPPSASDPGHFDHMMTNVYGNTINIKVPQTIITAAQTTQTTLPNTGPGASLVIGFVITMIIGYFFARSHLLSKEATLVRSEYTHNGDIA